MEVGAGVGPDGGPGDGAVGVLGALGAADGLMEASGDGPGGEGVPFGVDGEGPGGAAGAGAGAGSLGAACGVALIA